MSFGYFAVRGAVKIAGMVAGFVAGAGLGGGLVTAIVPFAVLAGWEPHVEGVIRLYVVGGALVGALLGLLAARRLWRERISVRP